MTERSQPAQLPSNANDDTWENNAKYLLERCPHTVRVREGGGPENLMHSFIHTFMAMEQKLRGSHETLGVDAEVAGQIWAALDDLYALVRKQDMEPAFRGRIERALSVGRWEPRVSQKAGAIATHFTFLWQRPKDKEPWGVIYADHKRAVDCPYRVSDVRPVRLERYPERTDQGDSGAVMPGDTL